MDAPKNNTLTLDEWLRQGVQLREQLLEERQRLRQRLMAIDVALASLPKAADPKRLVVSFITGTGADAEADDAPSLVRKLLYAHPAGLPAKEIVAALVKQNPKIDTRNIYSALSRGSKDKDKGYIVKNGKPGASIYSLREQVEGA